MACSLCGFEGHEAREVRIELVEFLEPEVHEIAWRRYDSVPRCVDRIACRQRVEAIPEPWPLNDGTPAA